MIRGISRAAFVRAAAAALGAWLAAAPFAAAQMPAPVVTPLLSRIKMATVAAPDIAVVEAWYTEWLGYSVAGRGAVSDAMAKSWGTPEAAGRPYVLMASEGSPDVFIRAVETDAVPGYRAMTTFGWNSIEIIVDDLDAVYERMKASPFRIIGEPHPLTGLPSIHAMQVIGPAEEVLYLTTETGDRSKSPLPIPQSLIDRPFIMVLAGPDADAMVNFYMDTFLMRGGPPRPVPIAIIAEAQGLAADHQFPLGLVRAAERGNNIEIDGYPPSAAPRPRADGQLPPGVAMTSFSVNSLDGLHVDFIAEPAALYDGMRAATFIGPAGELTELIEEPRP